MSRIVVSNTGPLITLEKLEDGYDFIRKLYDRIIIPPKVAEEISDGFSSYSEYEECYKLQAFIQIRRVNQIFDFPRMNLLDDGEIEAISLSHELHCELLIEEISGREIARSSGLVISGIAGKIGFACIQGIIEPPEALKKLQCLLRTGRINQEVFEEICEIAKV